MRIALITTLWLAPQAALAASPGWDYVRTGNARDLTAVTQGGFVLAGGSTDVDEAFRWMCAKAGGGDFLVLRASGTAAYNPYIRELCPALNSVATLIVSSRSAALDPQVAATILKAEALFIAGGDQADYINYYAGTPVAAAVNQLAARHIPVGGTSAGNAILAQFGYSALTGSVTSREALANPYSPLITISDSFLDVSPHLRGVFTDDHFAARDRMGRLIAFMARVIQDGSAKQVSAIATDEKTAFLLEPDGRGTVVGSASAYFLRTPGPPELCRPDTPLRFKGLPVYRVPRGGSFDLTSWTGTGGVAYTLSAIGGALQSSQPGGGVY